MFASRIHSIKKELAQYTLLGIPTMLLVAYAIKLGNVYLALLENNWVEQSLLFAAGMALAFSAFARRYRFTPITALMLTAAYFVARYISAGKVGEFDAFFWSVRFNTGALFFFLGWIAGYGFSRARFFSIAWSVFLLAIMAVVVATLPVITKELLVVSFAPMLVYTFYIIYTSELIRNLNEHDPTLLWQITKRLAGFGLVMILLILALIQWYKPQFEAAEKEWGGGSKPQENNNPNNSLTRNDGTGTSNNPNMGLNGFNNKANKDSVLFVARLENYFPDGKTPNPLYFTSDYYSKFDPETQAFETDTLRPFNDLFSPDISKIPLFFTRQDTGVLTRAMSNKYRKVATAEVYKHNLSARLFTAPTTAFFVQPISVPDENKNIYRSAYRAKMLVSELNSAYFVYNPAGDKGLEAFQEQRFEVLRQSKGYETTPKTFYNYYTYLPTGNDYDSIRVLAAQIAKEANAKTSVDKVIAVRDFFLRKDENNQPTFKYSDNPGIPGLPSANKLTYFLFQNKKGYCAYFAGATLFMLRAMGIPSRVATGFLTVDRSSKNPGWYWFYEDQAHAWVQVYFPEFGWIDFDTTVPDAEQQQAPQPDQTPPLESQTAWLVANGKAVAIDTATKKVTMQMEKMLYWDQPFEFIPQQPLLMDVSLAKITNDTGMVSLQQLKKDDLIVAVSYANVFKELAPKESENGMQVLSRFPSPAPIDEIKIMLSEEEKAAFNKKEKASKPINWENVLWTTLFISLTVVLLLLAMPYTVYWFLRSKAATTKAPTKKQYWRYMATMFYLHQMGFERNDLSPLQYARQTIDPKFGTQMEPFVTVYLQLKYSKQPLTDAAMATSNSFYPAVFKKVAQQLPFGYRFSHFINTRRMIHFFGKPALYV